MSASTHLAKYSVTAAQARDYIVANINTPQNIYNTAKQYSVTNQMLAEIYGGVTAVDVRNFFSNIGFDPSALDPQIAPAPTPAPAPKPAPAPISTSEFGTRLIREMDRFSELEINKLIKFNSAWGRLSDSSLIGDLKKSVGDANYKKAFSFSGFLEGQDGILTGSELGVPGLANATSSDQLASLFFGLVINFYQSFDESEMSQFIDFNEANKVALLNNDPVVVDQFDEIIREMVKDKPSSFVDQYVSNFDIQDVALEYGEYFVNQAVTNGLGFLYNFNEVNFFVTYDYV